MNRILVIRGGAIGDFILTLPALKALREAYPKAALDILGYSHIAELAHKRFYATGVRSIEYGALSRFFARQAELPGELADYFAGFDVIVSYLYDPDRIFESNLRRAGVENIVRGPAKVAGETAHAAEQLAEPMKEFDLRVTDLAAKIFPSEQDRESAREFLQDLPASIVALHPGSGGARKNWPLENWIALARHLLETKDHSLVVVSGEADEAQMKELRRLWPQHARVRFAHSLPLPTLAGVLARTSFVGHDSGISHLAAAVGAHCLLLFGPTNPLIWAPRGEHVRVLRASQGEVNEIKIETVTSVLPNEARDHSNSG